MNFPSELFWRRFLPTPGAIGAAEACAISWLASQVPQGLFADMGSHYGKSSMAAANSLPSGNLYMVDQVYCGDPDVWEHSVQKTPKNNPWAYTKEADFKEKVKENIKIVSTMEVQPLLVGDYSENFLVPRTGYAWVFIDSDNHCGGMAIREAKILLHRMVAGGIIAFHDVDNQFYDPRAAINYLVSTGKFEEINIPWNEIFNFVRAADLESKNNSWHQSGSEEFPKFVGAVRRK